MIVEHLTYPAKRINKIPSFIKIVWMSVGAPIQKPMYCCNSWDVVAVCQSEYIRNISVVFSEEPKNFLAQERVFVIWLYWDVENINEEY